MAGSGKGFFRRSSRKAGYDFFAGYAWDVPGVGGLFGLLAWLLAGALLGNLVTVLLVPLFGTESVQEYAMLISYPLMFVPALTAARYTSERNAMFETGYALDNRNFGRMGGWGLALLCMLATFALSFVMDLVNAQMPPMPEWLEDTLKTLTQGNLWVDFLCVSIMAPLLEEWLCRGMVLRGLLNCKRTDSAGNAVRGLRPVWAIILSALFFAVIHMNPWQALPAFVLGCLFGYVYYRTGSLKLTMLMHFTNNTVALVLGNIESVKEAETWLDILPVPVYAGICAACAVFLVWFVREVGRIALPRAQGACEEVFSIGENV